MKVWSKVVEKNSERVGSLKEKLFIKKLWDEPITPDNIQSYIDELQEIAESLLDASSELTRNKKLKKH